MSAANPRPFRPFIPEGTIGLVEASKRIARRLHQGRWSELFPPQEAEVWDGLEVSLNPQYVCDHIRVLVPEFVKRSNPSVVERLCDYLEAQTLLRNALFDGRITAFFINDQGERETIAKAGWGSESGAEVLEKGTAWISGLQIDICRYVLVSTDAIEREIDTLIASRPSDCLSERSQSAAATSAHAAPLPPSQVAGVIENGTSGIGPLQVASSGAARRAVEEALEALWGGTPPKALMAQMRDKQIADWCKTKGYGSPSTRTIQRVLHQARALREK